MTAATVPCQTCRTRYTLADLHDHPVRYSIADGAVWSCPQCRPVQYHPPRRAARRIVYHSAGGYWQAYGGRINPRNLGAYSSILLAVKRTGIGAYDALDLTGTGAV